MGNCFCNRIDQRLCGDLCKVILKIEVFWNGASQEGLDPQAQKYKKRCWKAAAIALHYHLHLPFCGHGFESKVHHIHFFNLYYWNCNGKRTKINKKRPRLAHFLKNFNYINEWTVSGCGSVGRVVASERGPQFESSHRQIYKYRLILKSQILINKRPWKAH